MYDYQAVAELISNNLATYHIVCIIEEPIDVARVSAHFGCDYKLVGQDRLALDYHVVDFITEDRLDHLLMEYTLLDLRQFKLSQV